MDQDPGDDRRPDAPRPFHTDKRRNIYRVPPRKGTAVGKALREDREARGLTQEEVAKAVDIYQTKLSNWELGKTRYPEIDALIRLAEFFGHPRNYYSDLAGWPSAAKLLDQLPPPDAMVVQDPLLQELLTAAEPLEDHQIRALIETARFEARHGRGPAEERRDTA